MEIKLFGKGIEISLVRIWVAGLAIAVVMSGVVVSRGGLLGLGYFSTCAGPLIVAMGVTTLFYHRSGLKTLGWERYFKRAERKTVGLSLVQCDNKEILLNRQTEHPFMGMWIPLGGFFNPEKGDEDLRATAERRVKELANLEVVARNLLAQTVEGSDYGTYIRLVYDMLPAHDEIYQVVLEKGRRNKIVRSDVVETEDLRWWSREEIANLDSDKEIPSFIKDVILYLSEKRESRSAAPRFWDIGGL